MDPASLLMDHVASDDTEAAHLRAALALVVMHCGDAPRRSTYDPGHLTASALILSPDHTSILLVHHEALGIWVQPGGHIDDDDRHVEAAAQREAAEETGLTDLAPLGLLDVDVHDIPERGSEPAHQHHDLRFGFVARSWEVRPGAGTTDVRWVALDDLTTYRVDAGLIRAAAKLASHA